MNVSLGQIVVRRADLRMVVDKTCKNRKCATIFIPLHQCRSQLHSSIDVLRIQHIASIEKKKIVGPIHLLNQNSGKKGGAYHPSDRPLKRERLRAILSEAQEANCLRHQQNKAD